MRLACRACGEIGLPAASFCASCGTPLRPECSACRREIPSETRFCPWCGYQIEATRRLAELAHEETAGRDSIPGGERRIATALFSDLAEYTALIERLDPEEVAGVMNRLKRTATRIVDGHGGMVNQFVGDEVMALFGVPRAHDDDPIRALRAAFELHAAVRELGDELAPRLGRALRLHTALDTGLMITQLRDPLDGVYGVTGGAINTAARLVKQAADDEVLIGPEAWRATRDHFESECIGPLHLRGKAEPIVAYRVLRATPRKRSSADDHGDALCGRRAELETLRGAFESALRGEARLVGVSGEPGVGKTRLFQEFAWRAQPHARVLRGQCLSLGTVAPYQPFRDVLRAALLAPDETRSELECAVERARALDCERHLPGLLALLSIQMDAQPMPGEAINERVEESYLGALQALLRALARERPLVLLLEDWHWADRASEVALAHLERTLARERVLLLVNFRSHQEPAWAASAQRLELAPFEVEDTRAIVRRLLGEVPESLLRRIQERTGGNPLFIEELCQTVRELGREHGLAAQRVVGDVVPDTVAAVVRARIDRLAPAQVELLKLASVLGEEFPRALLDQLCGSAARVEASLEGPVRADLLLESSDGESCRFKHAVVQDVAYAMLLHSRRRALHEAAGCAIEAAVGPRVEQQVERLAHHFARSDHREKAVFYLERSGDKAAASGAMVQALDHYREAVGILDELPSDAGQMQRRIALTQKLAGVAIYRPWRGMHGMLELSYEFAKRLGDARAERKSLFWMGWLAASLGSWREALDHFHRCVPLAEAHNDRKLLAQLDSNIGQALFHAGDLPGAAAHLERAIELRRGVGSARSAAPVVAYSLGNLALIDCESGRFDRADERLEEAFKLAEAAGQHQLDGLLRSVRTTVEALRGNWAGCAAEAEALAPKAQRIGSTQMLAMSQTLGGYSRYAQGERAEGVAAMRSGIALLERSENGVNLSLLYGCLAGALTVTGSLDEAEDLALRALERAALLDRMGEATARRVLFAVAARRAPQGGPEVEAAFEAALEVARRRGSARDEALTWLRAAEVLAQARDVEWRRKLLADCSARFETLQMPWYQARAEALLVELDA